VAPRPPHLDGFFTRFWKDCQTWSAAFPAAFREFAAYEAEAITIWTFHHLSRLVVPLHRHAQVVLAVR
jgi:hypothetical protein